jgi:hypothetical protein|tara:strand:- start:232 stop:1428 length:1197 start_codon:yes stop_codon:yes gene_type:complete
MKFTKNSNIPSAKFNIIIGFILFSISFSIFIFLNNSTNRVSNKMLEIASEVLPTLYLVVLATVLMPIIEEYIFRYSIVKSKFWQIITSILLIVIVSSLNFNYLLIISLVLFLIVTFYFRKKDLIFSNLMIYFSSLCFAFSHLQNLESTSSLSIISPIIVIFGLGLILISIRIRYGIFYSILVHILYNSVLISLSFWFAQSEITINNKSLYVNISRESMFSRQMGSSILQSGDTLLINNMPIHRIVKNNAPRKINSFYDIPTSIIKYSGKILIKKNDFKSFISSFGFNMDSTVFEKDGYKLTVDSNFQNSITKNLDTNRIYKRSLVGSSLGGVIKTISNELNTPIDITNFPLINLQIKINISYYSNLSFEQNILLINSKHNLNLGIKNKKIKCVNYYIR